MAVEGKAIRAGKTTTTLARPRCCATSCPAAHLPAGSRPSGLKSGDWDAEDPARSPPNAPGHCPKWGHGAEPSGIGNIWDPQSQVACNSIIGKTTFIGVT